MGALTPIISRIKSNAFKGYECSIRLFCIKNCSFLFFAQTIALPQLHIISLSSSVRTASLCSSICFRFRFRCRFRLGFRLGFRLSSWLRFSLRSRETRTPVLDLLLLLRWRRVGLQGNFLPFGGSLVGLLDRGHKLIESLRHCRLQDLR